MNYEWYQDENQIKLRFDIKNTTVSNIDVQVAEVVIKINILDKKFAKIVDLYESVIEGPIVYGNNVLEVTLFKVQPKKWLQLSPDLPKDQLILRRKEAFARKEQEAQSQKKLQEDLKLQFDQHATKEQMKVDDYQRNQIQTKYETQKKDAIEDLYSKIDNDQHFKQKNNDDILEKKIQQYEELEKQQELQQQQNNNNNNNNSNNNNDIFTNDDIIKQAKQSNHPLPEPRKAAAIQISFTEKVYPHLAAREQHFKDAPVPRQKNIPINEQRENPLFLKDKGDEFFKNKDYYSAINAYTAAYKYDNQMHSCIANRSACHLALFNYQECIEDCQIIIDLNKGDILYEKSLKRLRICQALKGDLEESLQDGIPEKAKELVLKRIESNKFKHQGDAYIQNSQYEKAIKMYKQSLDIESDNELTQSNLGLALMKINHMEEALNIITQVIQKVKPFLQFVNLNPNIGKQSSFLGNEFLLKNLMKKANCQFELNLQEDALDSVKQALKIDETNQEARTILNKIQDKLIKIEISKLKDQATENLRQKKFGESLQLYNECLKKLTPQEDLLDFLAILLNKSICCYYLEQYDEIIGSCTRGIKLIMIQSNKILSFEKITKDVKGKLNEFLVRFFVRRSNAYVLQGQLYNAKIDLQEALNLDPTNIQIQKDLEKLN